MTTLIQVCIVVVTIAVVVVAYVAARTMLQFEATAKKFQAGYARFEEVLEDSRQTSRKVRDLVSVLEQIANSMRTGIERIEAVVDRATSMSSMVLDEIAPPVRNVVAVMRGLRSGFRVLTELWMNGRKTTIQTREEESHV